MAKSKARKQPETVYELTITLRGTQPRIWRRFAVPGNITLARLHEVIQVVMGWHNCHLHEFGIREERYSVPDPDFQEEEALLNDERFNVRDVIGGKGMTFDYLYDFGDGWRHDLQVVNVGPPNPNLQYPVCLAGELACPPEDCGAVEGYYDLLKIIADPKHEQYTEMMDWLGGKYDPNEFDVEAINTRLEMFFT